MASRAKAVAAGASWCKISRCFCAICWTKLNTPVRLPPGRSRLTTSPISTGSAPMMKTIGIVVVEGGCRAYSRCASERHDDVHARRATRSAAMAGNRSTLAARPSIIDQHVAAFDIAGLGQAFAECGHEVRHLVRRRVPEKADHRHWALLRVRRQRPRRRRAAEQRYEFSPSNVDCHETLPWGFLMHRGTISRFSEKTNNAFALQSWAAYVSDGSTARDWSHL